MINKAGNLCNVLIYDCVEPMCRASKHVLHSIPFLCMTSREEEDEEKKKMMKKRRRRRRTRRRR